MMKYLLVTFSLFIVVTVNSQYYFTDIVSHQQSEEQYKALIASKVKVMHAKSYDGSENLATTFSIQQNIKEGGKKIITKTIVSNSGTTILTNDYNDSGKLITSVSSNIRSNTTVSTTTNYTYNNQGAITNITSYSSDTAAAASSLTETHIWEYNIKGTPKSMTRVKNKKDSLHIYFTYDDKGNVAEEKWVSEGHTIENYYYYYNEDNRLTDVVRYDYYSKKLLPDFIYEYYSDGRVSRMTQTVKGGTTYYIWKYTYNDKGLKATESCYNKQHLLEGKIVYEYE